jgi:hypothetical protein
MWNGTAGEPEDELEDEPYDAAAGRSESAGDRSKSDWALRESRRDLLMNSSSGWSDGMRALVEAARVGNVQG